MAGEASGTVRVPCPACGGRVKVPPGQAGQKCRCPKCNAEFVVPGLADSTPPAEVPTPAAVPKAAPAKPRPVENRLTPLEIGETPVVPPPSPESPPAERPATLVPRPPADDDQLADLSVPPPPPEPPAPVAAPAEEEFGFECTLCHTRLYAVPSQVGRYTRCPDCHTKVQIPRPKPRAKKADVLEDGGGEFRLSEPVERPPVPLLSGVTPTATPPTAAAPTTSAATPPPPSPPRGDVLAEQARSLLAKAEAEVAEEEEDLPKLVFDRSLTTGLISFLKDPQALARWIMLSLGGAAVVWLLNNAVAASQGGPVAQFGAVAMSVLVCLGGATVIMLAAVSGLVVLQDTSHGYEKIEQWPGGFNIMDWMLEAFYVINCALASFLPGFLLGRLVLPGIYGPLLGLATLAAAFPVFLLSALDAGSRIALYSATIWPSVRRVWPLWQMFYILSAGLAIGGLVAFLTMSADFFMLNVIGSTAFMGVVLIYFRLLGKLAGSLSLQFAQQDESAQNPAPDSESPRQDSKE